MRRRYFSVLFGAIFLTTAAGAQKKVENIIIVTTDGMRWQEVFRGMDSSLANKKIFNQGDSDYLYKTYWAADIGDRRKKLFPFLWSAFAEKGRLYGNRNVGNKVNVANPYFFSYPGYNEIFTGYPDTTINTNSFPDNPNLTVLAFLQQQPAFQNKIAAFGSWEAYRRILDADHSGFPVSAGFGLYGFGKAYPGEELANKMRADSYSPVPDEGCMDVFTHYGAMEYLKAHRPRVLYIAYLETDAEAHEKNYKNYLNAAHHVDKWLKDLWNYIQSDPFYKDKTALLITTDHGRGVGDKWTGHGGNPDASQIWFGLIAPGLPPRGEVQSPGQLYQKQFAQTIAALLGQTFRAGHPIGEAIDWEK